MPPYNKLPFFTEQEESVFRGTDEKLKATTLKKSLSRLSTGSLNDVGWQFLALAPAQIGDASDASHALSMLLDLRWSQRGSAQRAVRNGPFAGSCLRR